MPDVGLIAAAVFQRTVQLNCAAYGRNTVSKKKLVKWLSQKFSQNQEVKRLRWLCKEPNPFALLGCWEIGPTHCSVSVTLTKPQQRVDHLRQAQPRELRGHALQAKRLCDCGNVQELALEALSLPEHLLEP